MFALLKKRNQRKAAAQKLYESVVNQARSVIFYDEYRVPDNVDGRFELICLHMYLAMDRFFEQGREGERLAQALFDRMFKDMDPSLREMGVGDLGVPKHMKRMMQGFNGRANAYQEAMRSEDPQDLWLVLERNLYGTLEKSPQDIIKIMAVYMHESVHWLAAQPWETLLEGNIEFKVMNHEKSENSEDSVTRMVA